MDRRAVLLCKPFNNRDVGTYLYFAGMIPYLIARAWESSMLPRFFVLNKGTMLLFLCAIGLKILLYESFHATEFLIYAVCLAISALSYKNGGSIHLFMMVWLVMGSKDIKLTAILEVYCAISALFLALAFLGTKLGLFEDIAADKPLKILGVEIDWPKAHSYGICNTTDFAARVFFLFLTVLYLKGRSRLLPLCTLAGAVVLFLVSRGRIDSICLAVASFLWILDDFVMRKASNRGVRFWKKIWEAFGVLSMPFSALLMLGLCWIYNGSSLFTKLDQWTSERFSTGKGYFDRWGVSLLGQEIEMHGWGGHDSEAILAGKEYSFIDISYQQLLLINGISGLIIIIGFYVALARKNKRDTYLMYVIVLVSLNCMMAHHLLDFSYVPFIVALSAVNERVNEENMDHRFGR